MIILELSLKRIWAEHCNVWVVGCLFSLIWLFSCGYNNRLVGNYLCFFLTAPYTSFCDFWCIRPLLLSELNTEG